MHNTPSMPPTSIQESIYVAESEGPKYICYQAWSLSLSREGEKCHVHAEYYVTDPTDHGTAVWEGDVTEENGLTMTVAEMKEIKRNYGWIDETKPLLLILSEDKQSLVLTQNDKVLEPTLHLSK